MNCMEDALEYISDNSMMLKKSAETSFTLFNMIILLTIALEVEDHSELPYFDPKTGELLH